MNTVILVGRRAGQPERDRNWRLCSARWEELGWPIFEGHHNADEGPYSMSTASNRAAADAGDWEMAFYVGADFWLADTAQAENAARRAAKQRRLVFAHSHLTLLEEAETTYLEETGELLAGGHRHANTFSGAVAVPRALWDMVGGFDERFVGWGGEDLAFWSACCALGRGFDRVPGDMYHLFHPRTWEDNEGSETYPPNGVLMRRYIDAKSSKDDMLGILREEGGPLA